jgi:hypothetical protein
MYQFKWPLCKEKCNVGFSMMLQSRRWYRTRFVNVLMFWSCIKQCYGKYVGDGCLCKNCGLVEEWKTVCFLYCFLGLWAFWHAVLLVIYRFAFMIWSCHELYPWHIIHISGFISPNFLTYLPYDCRKFCSILGMGCGESLPCMIWYR